MNFDQIMLRAKQALKVSTDKEVSELLGMGKTAMAERKRRDAFPEEKLRRLAVERPDLNLDLEYILGGLLPEVAVPQHFGDSKNRDLSEWDKATYGMSRYERADVIIADYERQHDFKLPVPWRFTVSRLLRNGLSDPDLHLIFDTLMRVEFEAGRLDERPVDYKALAEDK